MPSSSTRRRAIPPPGDRSPWGVAAPGPPIPSPRIDASAHELANAVALAGRQPDDGLGELSRGARQLFQDGEMIVARERHELGGKARFAERAAIIARLTLQLRQLGRAIGNDER